MLCLFLCEFKKITEVIFNWYHSPFPVRQSDDVIFLSVDNNTVIGRRLGGQSVPGPVFRGWAVPGVIVLVELRRVVKLVVAWIDARVAEQEGTREYFFEVDGLVERVNQAVTKKKK